MSPLKLALLAAGLLIASQTVHAQEPPRRALFVSVIQEPVVFKSAAAMDRLIADAKRAGFETLFVQVYRGNRAWFDSTTADRTDYEQSVRAVGEDPLKRLIRGAHASGIKVHAWLNVLSLSANKDAPILKKYGKDVLTRELAYKDRIEEHSVDKQYFLEPGDPRVRRALADVVRELVTGYPELDGVEFDYIRYPDVGPDFGITKTNVARYKAATGRTTVALRSAEWKDWKRAQVSALVEELAGIARSARPGIQVSTTGLMPYRRANHEAYQDWRSWIQKGTVDFVTLMCYTRDEKEFARMLEDAARTLGTLERANLAVGGYALKDAPDKLADQWSRCEEAGARSCVYLGYGDLGALSEHLERTRA